MKINSLKNRVAFTHWALLLGLLLQCSMPLLDGQLIYRFSNWVSIHSNIEASDLQLIRQDVGSAEELNRVIADQTEQQEQEPNHSMLDHYLAADNARKQSQETAAEIRIMQQFAATLIGKYALSHYDFLPIDRVEAKQKAQLGFKYLYSHRIPANNYLQVPPLGGQSTLAP